MAERDGAGSRHRTQGVAGTCPPRGAAQGAILAPSPSRAWSSLLERLRAWVCAEASAGRLLPRVPVAFGAGIALYFTASHEPVLWAGIAVAAALAMAAYLLCRSRFFFAAVLTAAVAAGFATATFRTAHLAHTVLTRPLFSVALSGYVETRDIRERTDRFVLRVTQMDAPQFSGKLDRVRLSVRKGTAPDVGSFVELKARLQPPLAPLRPDSYDFSRDLFFQGIAGSGFVTGSIKVTEPPEGGGIALRYAAFMQGLRDAIDARIRERLDGDERAIATAIAATPSRRQSTTPCSFPVSAMSCRFPAITWLSWQASCSS
jgi:competence protein ComEC